MSSHKTDFSRGCSFFLRVTHKMLYSAFFEYMFLNACSKKSFALRYINKTLKPYLHFIYSVLVVGRKKVF